MMCECTSDCLFDFIIQIKGTTLILFFDDPVVCVCVCVCVCVNDCAPRFCGGFLEISTLETLKKFNPDQDDHLSTLFGSTTGSEMGRLFTVDMLWVSCWSCMCGWLSPEQTKALIEARDRDLLEWATARDMGPHLASDGITDDAHEDDAQYTVAPTPTSIANALLHSTLPPRVPRPTRARTSAAERPL